MKVILVVGLLMCPITTLGQYHPSRSQVKSLISKRARLTSLQRKSSDLQARVNFEYQELLKECRAVAVKNGWPDNVQCDLTTFGFYIPQPQPAQPPVPQAPVVDKKKEN